MDTNGREEDRIQKLLPFGSTICDLALPSAVSEASRLTSASDVFACRIKVGHAA
jgi:hypothetical protein